ncbi:hypothetical protein D3C75_1144930 [compost metagenome]
MIITKHSGISVMRDIDLQMSVSHARHDVFLASFGKEYLDCRNADSFRYSCNYVQGLVT